MHASSDNPLSPGLPPDFNSDSDADLDRRIDAALATYSDPGVALDPTLLAARVLSLANERPSNARTRLASRWLWMVTVPALAVLLVLIFAPRLARHRVFIHTQQMTTKTLAPGMHSAAPPNTAQTTQLASVKAEIYPASPRHTAQSPRQDAIKQDVFPTPQPLAEQEKLLIAFVAHTSPSTQQAAVQSAARMAQFMQPLKIPPVQIPELSIDQLKIPPLEVSALQIKPAPQGDPREERR